MEKIYPCPACNSQNQYYMERFNEICHVCGWEDDEMQRDNPAYDNGPNPVSLNEARKICASGQAIWKGFPILEQDV
jgi:hypothetical protein